MDTITDQHGQAHSNGTDLVHHLGLAGLTVLPIPDVDNITDVFKQVEHHHAQLINGSSTQETLIYRNTTAAHVDALTAHIHAVRTKGYVDHLDVLRSRTDDSDSIAALDTARTQAHAKYLDALTFLNDSDPRAALCATSKYHDAINRGKYPGLRTFFRDGLLFLKMSSLVAKSAQSSLHHAMIGWAAHMHLRLIYWGEATHQRVGQNHPPEQKQATFTLQPLLRGNEAHFPTVVIEEGSNQFILHREKDWWFSNSLPPDQPEGDVKIVVLVKVDRPAKSITIELWDRHHPQLASQTVTITPHLEESLSVDESLDDSSWVVEGAPLVIPFERVFLRPPKQDQDGETDFVMAEPAFVTMARECWQLDRMGVY